MTADAAIAIAGKQRAARSDEENEHRKKRKVTDECGSDVVRLVFPLILKNSHRLKRDGGVDKLVDVDP